MHAHDGWQRATGAQAAEGTCSRPPDIPETQPASLTACRPPPLLPPAAAAAGTGAAVPPLPQDLLRVLLIWCQRALHCWEVRPLRFLLMRDQLVPYCACSCRSLASSSADQES